jgi:hypothetical protein
LGALHCRPQKNRRNPNPDDFTYDDFSSPRAEKCSWADRRNSQRGPGKDISRIIGGREKGNSQPSINLNLNLKILLDTISRSDKIQYSFLSIKYIPIMNFLPHIL